jgi:hypothetical protein
MTLEDIRIAGDVTGLGNLCSWGDPRGWAEPWCSICSARAARDITLDLFTTTRFSEQLSIPPSAIVQPTSFALGSGVSLQTFAAAAETGVIDGLFATRTQFVGESSLLGQTVTFTLDLSVTNKATPPSFSSISRVLRAFSSSRAATSLRGERQGAICAPNPPTEPLRSATTSARRATGCGSRVGTFSDRLAPGRHRRGLTGIFSSSSVSAAARRACPAREAGTTYNRLRA